MAWIRQELARQELAVMVAVVVDFGAVRTTFHESGLRPWDRSRQAENEIQN